MTPLIDVVFLLLVFFILAGRFEQNRARLTLLEASAGEASSPAPAYLLVRVHGRDSVDLAGERMDLAQLIDRLRAQQGQTGRSVVVLTPTGRLELGDLVAVVDSLRGAGIGDLALLPD